MAKSKKRKPTAKKTETSRSVGRPSKLTTELVRKVRLALRGGAYLETVAPFIGVRPGTFRDWLKVGAQELQEVEDGKRRKPRKKFELHCELSLVLEQALAELEVECSAIMLQAAKGYTVTKRKTVRRYGAEVYDSDGNKTRPILEETITEEETLRRDWRAAERLAQLRFATRWANVDRDQALKHEKINNADDRAIEWSFLGPDEPDDDEHWMSPDPNDPRY